MLRFGTTSEHLGLDFGQHMEVFSHSYLPVFRTSPEELEEMSSLCLSAVIYFLWFLNTLKEIKHTKMFSAAYRKQELMT